MGESAVSITNSQCEETKMHKQIIGNQESIVIDGNTLSLSIYYKESSLYWEMNNYDTTNDEYNFIISSSDKAYPYFEILFKDLVQPEFISFESDQRDYVEPITPESIRTNCSNRNQAIQKYKQQALNLKLINAAGDTITLISDHEDEASANTLRIKKVGDAIYISFEYPKNSVAKDKPASGITVKLSTYGSRYDGFFYPFMKMYEAMLKSFAPHLYYSIRPIGSTEK